VSDDVLSTRRARRSAGWCRHLAGLLLAAAFQWLTGDLSRRAFLLLPAVSALMLTVGVVAALGPARRGLAVQPTEAPREE
jgi:hypothetical protein